MRTTYASRLPTNDTVARSQSVSVDLGRQTYFPVSNGFRIPLLTVLVSESTIDSPCCWINGLSLISV
jgi:hypothetical protein